LYHNEEVKIQITLNDPANSFKLNDLFFHKVMFKGIEKPMLPKK